MQFPAPPHLCPVPVSLRAAADSSLGTEVLHAVHDLTGGAPPGGAQEWGTPKARGCSGRDGGEPRTRTTNAAPLFSRSALGAAEGRFALSFKCFCLLAKVYNSHSFVQVLKRN